MGSLKKYAAKHLERFRKLDRKKLVIFCLSPLFLWIVYRLFISFGLIGGNKNAFPPTPVHVVQTQYRKFYQKTESVGTSLASEFVEISSKVTETVYKINFTEGQRVEKGDVLVELTNRRESALLEEAQATFAERRKNYRRIKDLVDSKTLPKARLEQSYATYQAAKSRVDQLKASLQDQIITAPFSGVLGLKEISVGTLLRPGTIVTKLSNVNPIKVEFLVPEIFFSSLQRDLIINFKTPIYPGENFAGKIIGFDVGSDPQTRSIRVHAQVENSDLKLRQGFLMTAQLLRNRRTSLAVPELSIVPKNDQQFVYVVKNDKASLIPVVVGLRLDGLVEIKEGLKEGDLIVTEGTVRLRPDAPIIIQRNDPLPQLKSIIPFEEKDQITKIESEQVQESGHDIDNKKSEIVEKDPETPNEQDPKQESE